MITDILSRTVSELLQLIVQILDTLRFLARFKWLRDNVRCSSWAHWKARSGLAISVNWTLFARCYGWCAMSENRSKIGDFARTLSVWPKISGRRVSPLPIIFTRIVRPYLTTLSLTLFTQKNLVADFLQAKCDFRRKTAVLRFWASLGSLGATYDDHLRLIGKHVVDFLLVLIELFSLGVTAEALRANNRSKLAILVQQGPVDLKFR